MEDNALHALVHWPVARLIESIFLPYPLPPPPLSIWWYQHLFMSQSQYHVYKYIHANIFVILFWFFKTIIFVILVIWRQTTLNQIINNVIYHRYRNVEVFLALVLTKQKYFFAHYRIVFGQWPKGDFLNIFKVRHHNLVDRYEISISQMTIDLFLFTYRFSFFYHCQDFHRTVYE